MSLQQYQEKWKKWSPLHSISPYVWVPLLDWSGDCKTRRRSADLCPRCRLHLPANRNQTKSRCSLFFISSFKLTISAWDVRSPPRPAEPPAASLWRWCPPVRGSVAPSRWGGAGRSAGPGVSAPAASYRVPRQCRGSAATAGCAEGGSHRSGWQEQRFYNFKKGEVKMSKKIPNAFQ